MDAFFGLDTPTAGDRDTALLTTTHDPVELSILRSILDTEQIPYRVLERGSGGIAKVIAGYSTLGTDIFVPTACLEAARELLDAYRNGEVVEDGETPDEV